MIDCIKILLFIFILCFIDLYMVLPFLESIIGAFILTLFTFIFVIVIVKIILRFF